MKRIFVIGIKVLLIGIFGLLFINAVNNSLYDDSCYVVLRCVPDHWVHAPGSTTVAMRVEDFGWSFTAESGSLTEPEPAMKIAHHRINFEKAWLEYSERGTLFNVEQKSGILKRIAELQATHKRLLVVVYVHGWRANADDTSRDPGNHAVKFDNFLARYDDEARRLFEQRQLSDVPYVLGVYIGWRGKEIATPIADFLTIGGRATVADSLASADGPGTIRTDLAEISGLLQRDGDRMLVAGQSLGARILSRLYVPQIASGTAFPLGKNTTLLAIEPAIGADCFQQAMTIRYDRQIINRPSFLTITSINDWALNFLYPLAAAIIPSCDAQSPLRSTTIGNYPPYQSLDIRFDYLGESIDKKALSDQKVSTYPALESKTNWFQSLQSRSYAYAFYDALEGDCKFAHGAPCYNVHDAQVYSMSICGLGASLTSPIWNIRTDDGIIGFAADSEGAKSSDTKALKGADSDHNGYVSTNLTRAIVELMYGPDDQVASSVPAPCPPTVRLGVSSPRSR